MEAFPPKKKKKDCQAYKFHITNQSKRANLYSTKAELSLAQFSTSLFKFINVSKKDANSYRQKLICNYSINIILI